MSARTLLPSVRAYSTARRLYAPQRAGAPPLPDSHRASAREAEAAPGDVANARSLRLEVLACRQILDAGAVAHGLPHRHLLAPQVEDARAA